MFFCFVISEWVVDQFGMSVSMSTYLVAFAVCNYKSVKRNTTKYNIEIEVAARPDAIEAGHGDYGLDETARIIDFYSDYFDNIYPLPKSSSLHTYIRIFFKTDLLMSFVIL